MRMDRNRRIGEPTESLNIAYIKNLEKIVVSELIFKIERRARWNFDVPRSIISETRYKNRSPRVKINLPFWELLQHKITSQK